MAWQPQPGQYDSPYSNAIPDPPPPSNGLNGFKDHSLDDDAFGAKGSIVSAFDAFRKDAPSPFSPPSTYPPILPRSLDGEPKLTPSRRPLP